MMVPLKYADMAVAVVTTALLYGFIYGLWRLAGMSKSKRVAEAGKAETGSMSPEMVLPQNLS
jgi:hypothetical protein